MITRVKTDKGESWAITLSPAHTLEDIAAMKSGLTELMITATSSDCFSGTQDGYYWALSLLRELLITSSQALDIEREMWKNGTIKCSTPFPKTES